MSNLQGKVAVVTGASKGIGAGIARALGAAGAAVVVNYASDRSGAEKAVADIKAKGGKAVAVKGDVSKSADVKCLFDETRKAFGKLDVLVNNAGVFKFAPLEETTEAEYQRQFGINVLGPYRRRARRCPVRAARRQRDQYFLHRQPHGHSRLLDLCRHQGRAGHHYPGAGLELGPRKIRVNSINPGMVESEGTHTAGFIGSDFQKDCRSPGAIGPHRPA